MVDVSSMMNSEVRNTMRPLKRTRASKSYNNEGEVSWDIENTSCTRPCVHISSSVPFRRMKLRSIIAVVAVSLACLEIGSVGALVPQSIYPHKQRYLPCSRGMLPIQRRSWRISQSFLKSMHIKNELSSGPFTNSTDKGTITSYDRSFFDSLLLHDKDIARPTENGGYTHTTASRAKISAANRGKTPWNKGKDRSEETRAKIAAGVRARNRQRFLEKLQAMGVTEEEYNEEQAQKQEHRRQEILARRTEKGGYRPTVETRQKISKVLKEKHANGLVKRRTPNPSKVRRGFTHSEETRRKISESLRKRWANDENYRQNMKEKTQKINSSIDTRRRISETLKAKWKDEEFRAIMLARMSNRKQRIQPELNERHRKNISDAMKAKWQDEVYRQRTLEGIARSRDAMVAARPPKPPRVKVSKPGTPREKSERKQRSVVARQVLPRTTPRQVPPEKTRTKELDEMTTSLATPAQPKRAPSSKTAASADSSSVKTLLVAPISEAKPKKAARKKKTNGDVTQLREERRDLFDLLYGDDVSEKVASIFEDEDLEDFDPYGLENG